ncbi:concanavalin A-like lectin/glucanase domain-containing protein [Bisporella sp. PMI_857]|nr:concanavalin A-like lectin/glucanase domain-containing protein [Bisporella sp. PMI_857]
MAIVQFYVRLLEASCLVGIANAAYTLQDNYNISNFYDTFTFFAAADPTNGFVSYQTIESANESSLAGIRDGAVYMGVDYLTLSPSNPGRESVRVSSDKTYNRGLFIADIAHMPSSECGVWPAFWLLGTGSTWPAAGEIDVIEGVNDYDTNSATMHTSATCNLVNQPDSNGIQENTNCNDDQGRNGCSVKTTDTTSYGTGFNAVGGGVYAMEWTSAFIKVFFFPRSSIPTDITSGNPDPSTWKNPQAHFAGSGCDIDEHFKDHQMIFDTTFCGDWAGKEEEWAKGTCGQKADTCVEYVSQNPQAFKEAYWQVNYVKVFQDGDAGNNATSKAAGKFKPRGSNQFFRW